MKKFWLYGEFFGSSVGRSVVLGIVLSLISGVGLQDGGTYLFQTMAIYCMIVGMMILLVTPFSLYQSYVPLMLSMNCRRKEIFWGFQGLKLVNAAGVALAGGIFMLIQNYVEKGSFGMDMRIPLFSLGFLLLGSSLGNLAGILYYRFGKIAMVIFMVCCGASGGSIGFLSAMGAKRGSFALLERLTGDDTGILGAYVLTAALLLIAADGVVSWMSLKKMEIR